MSLIALPLIVGATREALHSIPRHVREASYALGKTGRDDPPRPAAGLAAGIATGTALGMGRIVGDTAIVVSCSARPLQLEPHGGTPVLGPAAGHRQHADQLRLQQLAGGRGRLAGEGLRGRLRAAAVVIGLNFAVDLIARGREPSWTR